MSFQQSISGAVQGVLNTAAAAKYVDNTNITAAPEIAQTLNNEFNEVKTNEESGIEKEAQLHMDVKKSNEQLKKAEKEAREYASQFTDLNSPEGKLLDAMGMAKKPTSGQQSWMTRQSKSLEKMRLANATLQGERDSVVESNRNIVKQKDLLLRNIERAQRTNKYVGSYLSENILTAQEEKRGGKK